MPPCSELCTKAAEVKGGSSRRTSGIPRWRRAPCRTLDGKRRLHGLLILPLTLSVVLTVVTTIETELVARCHPGKIIIMVLVISKTKMWHIFVVKIIVFYARYS